MAKDTKPLDLVAMLNSAGRDELLLITAAIAAALAVSEWIWRFKE